MQTYDFSGITRAGSKFINDEEGVTNYLYDTSVKSISYNSSYTRATIKLRRVGDIRSATFTFKGNYLDSSYYGTVKSGSLEIPKLGKIKFSGLDISMSDLNDYDLSDLEGGKAEKIIGSKYDDKFWGYGRNDKLYGRKGKDILKGGSGHDKLYGGSGKDKLYGNSGNDYLNGGSSADKLYGGSGIL